MRYTNESLPTEFSMELKQTVNNAIVIYAN